MGAVWRSIHVRNVTDGAIYPVLPDPSRNNGRVVLIAPGGGYRFVSIDREGFAVAERLAAEGYVAVALKYRTVSTPRGRPAFLEQVREQIAAFITGTSTLADAPDAVADFAAAIELIRRRASDWNVDPGAINVVGFSAGGRSVVAYLEQHGDAQLQSAALIYPPMTPIIGGAKPPLFLAIAADDPLFRRGGVGLVERWVSSGGAVEFHLYSAGGHAFAMRQTNTTSDLWLVEYLAWLGLRH